MDLVIARIGRSKIVQEQLELRMLALPLGEGGEFLSPVHVGAAEQVRAVCAIRRRLC